MAKTIDVMVSPEGEIQIKTTGYKGTACLKATEGLERALGTKTQDTPTPEMKQTEAKHNVDIGRKV